MNRLHPLIALRPGMYRLLLLWWLAPAALLFGQTDTSIAVTVHPRTQLTGTVSATTAGETPTFTLTDLDGAVHTLRPEEIEYFTRFDRKGNKLVYRSGPDSGAGAEFLRRAYQGRYDLYASPGGTTWLYSRTDSSFVRVPADRQLQEQFIDSLLPRPPVLRSGRMYRGGAKRMQAAIAYMDSPFRKYPAEYFTLGIAISQFRDAYRFRTGSPPGPGNPNGFFPTLVFTNHRLSAELAMVDGFNARGNVAMRVALGGSVIRGNTLLRENSLTYAVSRNASLVYGDLGLRWYVGHYRLFPYLEIGGRVDYLLRDKFLAAEITRRDAESTLRTATPSLLRTGVSPRCSAGLEIPLTARRYVDVGLAAYYLRNVVGAGRPEYQVSIAINFNS